MRVIIWNNLNWTIIFNSLFDLFGLGLNFLGFFWFLLFFGLPDDFAILFLVLLLVLVVFGLEVSVFIFVGFLLSLAHLLPVFAGDFDDLGEFCAWVGFF